MLVSKLLVSWKPSSLRRQNFWRVEIAGYKELRVQAMGGIILRALLRDEGEKGLCLCFLFT